jgi:hypothetical protein
MNQWTTFRKLWKKNCVLVCTTIDIFFIVYAATYTKKEKKYKTTTVQVHSQSTYKAISASQPIPNNHCRPTGTNTSWSSEVSIWAPIHTREQFSNHPCWVLTLPRCHIGNLFHLLSLLKPTSISDLEKNYSTATATATAMAGVIWGTSAFRPRWTWRHNHKVFLLKIGRLQDA